MSAINGMPRRAIALAALVLIIAFMAIYLKDADLARLRELRVDPTLLVVASIFALSFRYWMVTVWVAILRALGARGLPGFSVMAGIYAKSWMARYIPGTIAWIAGKVYLASRFGISKSRLAASSFLEGGIQVAAVAVVSLLAIGLSKHVSQVSPAIKAIALSMSLISVVLLHPVVFNRLLRFAYVFIKRKEPSEELRINGKAVVVSFAMFAIGAILGGTGNYFMAAAIADQVGPGLYLYIMGVFGLAGAVGMATPLLPSGIGVKDGTQLVLLSLVLPKEIALAITIFSRVWQVLIDVVFLLAAMAQEKLLGKTAT